MDSSKEAKRMRALITLSTLTALTQGVLMPKEEDFRQLADDLESNPPPDLTPGALVLVTRILRAENIP